MNSKKFTRTVEDFVCGHCGQNVIGNGYTNHCPMCLWSKHVDKNPGDRLASCGGLMEPIAIEKEGKGYMIVQKCQICGFVRRNGFVEGDNFEALVAISKNVADKGQVGR